MVWFGNLACAAVLITVAQGSCPVGQWETGSGECQNCTLGQYGFVEDGVSKCKNCPWALPVTLSEGTVGSENCLAAKGGFRLGNKAGYCESFLGTSCPSIGLTVETVGILQGFWRPNVKSLDVRQCKTGFCVGSPAGKSVREELDELCATGHTGTLCSSCKEGFAMTADGCTACTDEEVASAWRRLIGWTFLIVLALISPSVYLGVKARSLMKQDGGEGGVTPQQQQERRTPRGWKLALSCFMKACTSGKCRVVLTWTQILYQFITTIALASATAGKAQNNPISGLNIVSDVDITALLGALDVGCAFQTNYYDNVLIFAAFPVVMCLCMALTLGMIKTCYKESLSTASFKQIKTAALYLVLMILYIIYPGVSSAIIRSYIPERFWLNALDSSESVSFLLPELSIEYSSPSSEAWRKAASILIFLFPVCILGLFVLVVMAYHSRHQERLAQVQRGEEVDMGMFAAAEFLVKSFKEDAFWFECIELLRKLLLTVVFIAVFKTSPSGAQVYFLLTLAGFAVLLLKLEPYEESLEQLLAELSYAVLAIVAVSIYAFEDLLDEMAFVGIALETAAAIFAVALHAKSIYLKQLAEQASQSPHQPEVAVV